MLLFYHCGSATPVRLTSGLVITLSVSAIHTLLYNIGIMTGDLLRFESDGGTALFARTNAYIMLGLMLFIIIKMLLPYLRREPKVPVFDLRNRKSVLAMVLATGINVLLIGIAVGLVTKNLNLHMIIWPLLVASFLLGYLGLMCGRQKVKLRPRIWMIACCILLLGVTVATTVNAG